MPSSSAAGGENTTTTRKKLPLNGRVEKKKKSERVEKWDFWAEGAKAGAVRVGDATKADISRVLWTLSERVRMLAVATSVIDRAEQSRVRESFLK